MQYGFPAILTPQLKDVCSEIKVGKDEESWIGELLENKAKLYFGKS